MRSIRAYKDPTWVLVIVASSEYKVYDYLVETSACNLTRENIDEFLEKSKQYDLAKAEVLNIINIRLSSAEMVEMVVEVLPPPPTE
ncbi:hypothetical protein UlMin_037299 [Ulmus minor]